jgi:hypothetical protein
MEGAITQLLYVRSQKMEKNAGGKGFGNGNK